MKTEDKKTLKDTFHRKKNKKRRKKGTKPASIQEQSLPILMALVEKHQNYMKFLKDCGMLTPERTTTIVQEIDSIFAIIKDRETGAVVNGEVDVVELENVESDDDSTDSCVS